MKIQLIRNATLKISYAGKNILLDPMFSPKGALRSFAGIAPNPTVELPFPKEDVVKDIDMVLVSHTHPDHFDEEASKTLSKEIMLFHQSADTAFFATEGFTYTTPVNSSVTWEGITITKTDGKHGSGDILQRMGEVSGFILSAVGEPTLYIVGDSIWNDDVESSIIQFAPDIIVTNSGGAVIPGFEATPILMDAAGTLQVVEAAPLARVVAVHMESLDHCTVERDALRALATKHTIGEDRLLIPKDGETISF